MLPRKFLAELLAHKEVRVLLSDEHFSVDGTQIAAWASMKSFQAKDGSSEPPSSGRNGERDFHRETRTNATHASTIDPEAKLYRKGKGQGGEALLYRERDDGEPPRLGGRGRGGSEQIRARSRWEWPSLLVCCRRYAEGERM